jgi:hypothetical protein
MSLKLDRRYNGQQCISEYHYVASGVPAAVTLSYALAFAFGVIDVAGVYDTGKPFGSLKAFQNTDVTYVEAVVKDLYSVTDFFTTPFLTGTHGDASNSSGSMSPYEAVALRTNRIRSDIRRGQKRYEGLTEGAVTAFGGLDSAFATAVAGHAALLSDTLTYTDEGNSLTFTPCVISLKKIEHEDAPTEYVKWPTEAEQLEHLASGVVWSLVDHTTTQNTRKVGRGS